MLATGNLETREVAPDRRAIFKYVHLFPVEDITSGCTACAVPGCASKCSNQKTPSKEITLASFGNAPGRSQVGRTRRTVPRISHTLRHSEPNSCNHHRSRGQCPLDPPFLRVLLRLVISTRSSKIAIYGIHHHQKCFEVEHNQWQCRKAVSNTAKVPSCCIHGPSLCSPTEKFVHSTAGSTSHRTKFRGTLVARQVLSHGHRTILQLQCHQCTQGHLAKLHERKLIHRFRVDGVQM